MKHIKTYHSLKYNTRYGQIMIEGPLNSDVLHQYNFHKSLTTFRDAAQQFKALKMIADSLEGRVIIAQIDGIIIGYVVFLYPDPKERWAKFNIKHLLMLGAIEVAPEFRNLKIGSNLLVVSMMDKYIENYIITSTNYHWHWDLRGENLNIWNYQKIMKKMMSAGKLKPVTTDDPEIMSHSANCLMVRIGKNVPDSSIKQFNELRFLKKQQLSIP